MDPPLLTPSSCLPYASHRHTSTWRTSGELYVSQTRRTPRVRPTSVPRWCTLSSLGPGERKVYVESLPLRTRSSSERRGRRGSRGRSRFGCPSRFLDSLLHPN